MKKSALFCVLAFILVLVSILSFYTMLVPLLQGGYLQRVDIFGEDMEPLGEAAKNRTMWLGIIAGIMLTGAATACALCAVRYFNGQETKAHLAALLLIWLGLLLTFFLPGNIYLAYNGYGIGWMPEGFQYFIRRICYFKIGLYQICLLLSGLIVIIAPPGRKGFLRVS